MLIPLDYFDVFFSKVIKKEILEENMVAQNVDQKLEKSYQIFEEAWNNAKNKQFKVPDLMLMAIVIRFKNAYKACLLLLEYGLYHDAYAVTRNAFEATILISGYMKYGNDVEFVNRLLIEYYNDEISSKNNSKEKSTPAEVLNLDRQIIELKGKLSALESKGFQKFRRSTIDEICKIIGIPKFKEFFYRVLCKETHVLVYNIYKHIKVDHEKNEVEFIENYNYEEDCLVIKQVVNNLLLIVTSVLNEKFKLQLVLDKTFEELYQEMQGF